MTLDMIAQRLQAFEDLSVLPLLAEIRAEPVRDVNFQLTLTPGSIAFLVNNANAYEVVGDVAYWQPLTVLYCDPDDQKGEVFRFRAVHDRRGARLVMAEIANCYQCLACGPDVELRNPINDRKLLRVRTEDPNGLVLNAWYVFRGAILPLLYHDEYRFMQTMPDRVRFQAQMLHQIRAAYQGVT